MLKWQITVAWNRKLKPIRVLKTDVHTTICQAKRQLRHQKQICYWFTNKLRMFLFSLFWDPTHPSLWFSYKWDPILKWDPSKRLGSQLLDWDPSFWTGIPVSELGSWFNWDLNRDPNQDPTFCWLLPTGIPVGCGNPTGICISHWDLTGIPVGSQLLFLWGCHPCQNKVKSKLYSSAESFHHWIYALYI